MKRLIVYGDIHGCLDEFIELRNKIIVSNNDIEIIIGDFLDKGLFSNEVLKYIRENNIKSILGNHEYKYIRYHYHQQLFLKTNKKNPIQLSSNQQKIYLNFIQEDLKYLQSLPFFMKFNNITLLHAGITNKIFLSENNNKDLEKTLWIRYVDENDNPLSLNSKIQGKWWSEVYDGHDGLIIYGHQPFNKVKIDTFSFGIDTGCVYGGKLTALIINNIVKPIQNYEIIQVKAKQKYIDYFI